MFLRLKKEDIPTAIMFIGDNTAIGAYEAIYEEGLKIPQNFSIVGYDDIFVSKYLSPPLTTIFQSKYELGTISMNLLIEKIKNPKNFSEIKLIPELKIRKSSAPIGN